MSLKDSNPDSFARQDDIEDDDDGGGGGGGDELGDD